MGLFSLQALSIVIIIYFLPATLITTWLCYTRGIGNQWGWLYLALLSIARVAGAALQMAAEERSSAGIRIAAELIASVGITALLLTMLEIIQRIKTAMQPQEPIPPRIWTFLHLTQYAVFILYIVGMSLSRDDLNKAAMIMVAVIFVLQSAICVLFCIHPASRKCDRRLLVVAVLSIPFLTVRVGYGLSTMFIADDSAFRVNVVIMAVLQFLMEFIVVGLFVYTGVVLVPRKGGKKGEGDSELEILHSEEGHKDGRSEP